MPHDAEQRQGDQAEVDQRDGRPLKGSRHLTELQLTIQGMVNQQRQQITAPHSHAIGQGLGQIVRAEAQHQHGAQRHEGTGQRHPGMEGRTAVKQVQPAAEKIEGGEILYNLSICRNHAADAHKPYLCLKRESGSGMGEAPLPNFRQGDAVVLYERNEDADDVTNRLVFKGNIEQISDTEVRMRLRATQQNAGVLPAGSLYAMEHDYMDITLDVNNRERSLEIIRLYFGIRGIYDFLSFRFLPPLSSGEFLTLLLFSRLNRVLKDQRGRDVVLFLDEVDTLMHPENQKRYVYQVLSFLNERFDIDAHVIFATHSPILLSDFPSSNVICLRKSEDRTTVEEV